MVQAKLGTHHWDSGMLTKPYHRQMSYGPFLLALLLLLVNRPTALATARFYLLWPRWGAVERKCKLTPDPLVTRAVPLTSVQLVNLKDTVHGCRRWYDFPSCIARTLKHSNHIWPLIIPERPGRGFTRSCRRVDQALASKHQRCLHQVVPLCGTKLDTDPHYSYPNDIRGSLDNFRGGIKRTCKATH